MSDTFPDETLYPVLTSLADEDRIFASNSAAGHESSQIKGSTIKGLINALKGTPPETLDTLAKLATAINNDPNFHTTLATALGLKQDASNAVTTNTNQTITGVKTYDNNAPLRFDRASGGYFAFQFFFENALQWQWYQTGQIVTVRHFDSNGNYVEVMRFSHTNKRVEFNLSPTVPTATASNNSTLAASTAFVQAQKADTALTGTPTAPTAAAGTNTTQLATTAFCAAGFIPQFSAVVETGTNVTSPSVGTLYVNTLPPGDGTTPGSTSLACTLPSPTGNGGKVIGFTCKYGTYDGWTWQYDEANWSIQGHIDGVANNTDFTQLRTRPSGVIFWCNGTTWMRVAMWEARDEHVY